VLLRLNLSDWSISLSYTNILFDLSSSKRRIVCWLGVGGRALTESFPQVTTLIRYQLLQQEWGQKNKKKRPPYTEKSSSITFFRTSRWKLVNFCPSSERSYRSSLLSCLNNKEKNQIRVVLKSLFLKSSLIKHILRSRNGSPALRSNREEWERRGNQILP